MTILLTKIGKKDKKKESSDSHLCFSAFFFIAFSDLKRVALLAANFLGAATLLPETAVAIFDTG